MAEAIQNTGREDSGCSVLLKEILSKVLGLSFILDIHSDSRCCTILEIKMKLDLSSRPNKIGSRMLLASLRNLHTNSALASISLPAVDSLILIGHLT